jgi:hypothetical protein
MLRRAQAELSYGIGLFIFGMLVGSWLGEDSSIVLWLIVALGGLMVVSGIVVNLLEIKRPAKPSG